MLLWVVVTFWLIPLTYNLDKRKRKQSEGPATKRARGGKDVEVQEEDESDG